MKSPHPLRDGLGFAQAHRQSHVHHIRNLLRMIVFSEFANTQTTESPKQKANHLQGVPLPVIIGVITPISRVITPLNHHTTTESLKFVDVFYSVLSPTDNQLNFQLENPENGEFRSVENPQIPTFKSNKIQSRNQLPYCQWKVQKSGENSSVG